jgi:hypothetical protein
LRRAPYDIIVRWKPLHEQAIGWNPALNDGKRMNTRPYEVRYCEIRRRGTRTREMTRAKRKAIG